MIWKIGVKKFLNPYDSRCDEFKKTGKGFEFNLRISGNPLLNFVDLPLEMKNGNLQYQSILKGVIRGTFETLKFKCQVTLIYENLKGEKNESIFFVELAKEEQME